MHGVWSHREGREEREREDAARGYLLMEVRNMSVNVKDEEACR